MRCKGLELVDLVRESMSLTDEDASERLESGQNRLQKQGWMGDNLFEKGGTYCHAT